MYAEYFTDGLTKPRFGIESWALVDGWAGGCPGKNKAAQPLYALLGCSLTFCRCEVSAGQRPRLLPDPVFKRSDVGLGGSLSGIKWD
jgi:hypothetical protein